jgi:hypothetical protein
MGALITAQPFVLIKEVIAGGPLVNIHKGLKNIFIN